jgi:hypothetical protein
MSRHLPKHSGWSFALVAIGCVAGLWKVSDANAALLRGPYLQQGTPTNIIIRWRTDTTNIGRVWFGTNLADLAFVRDETAAGTNHLVQLTNLLPDTIYHYAVGTPGQALTSGSNYFFRTAPPVGSRRSFRVWVLGDFGFTNASAGPVRNAYSNFTANRYTDLWMMVGDNAYHNGADSVWQVGVFNTYSNILRQTPVWSCLGNQETFGQPTVSNGAPYFENFTFPTNAECGGVASGTEKYFSFDYGNVHFICLDSMTSARTNGSPMLVWLEADLQQNTSEWTVAFWHHPPYSKGSNDSDSQQPQIEMRTYAVALLETYGVDLILGGHSHSYERSWLIDGHYGPSGTFNTNAMRKNTGNGRIDGNGSYDKPTLGSAAHEGAVYLVAGNGAALGGGTLNHPAMFRSLNVLGSVALDFQANRLDVKFIRETGVIDDYFTMTKGGTPLRIQSVGQSGTNLLLSWQTVAQRTYQVLSSAFPAPPWSVIAGPFTGDGTVTNVALPILPGATNGFLRLSTPGN